MFNRDVFSKRLKILRSERRVTMVDVAGALNISKQSIHQWETMRTIPNADKLTALADFFDVSLDYLVGRSDNPARH